MEEFLTFLHHQNANDEDNVDIMTVYSELGGTLAMSEKIDEASDLLKKGLQMSRNIHGLGLVRPNIANSMSELGKLYQNGGKLEQALKMHGRCFQTQQTIHREE